MQFNELFVTLIRAAIYAIIGIAYPNLFVPEFSHVRTDDGETVAESTGMIVALARSLR